MEHHCLISRLNPFAPPHRSINNTGPSGNERPASVASVRRCGTKVTTEEQRAKAREHQKRWREKLKTDDAKRGEYREMQRERTRLWKEKMRINEAERFAEISRKHQEQCKKWWDKLTPEQRREKRKQYNMKWRQNLKKNEMDLADMKEAEDWKSQKSYNEQLSENETTPKMGPSVAPNDYCSKPNNQMFNMVSGGVVYPFSYFPFRCQVQDAVQRENSS